MDDRRTLDSLPLPIARGLRRHRNSTETRERHDAAYYLFEIYLKYAASLAIARYLAAEGRDHRVNAALKGLARPSLGEWARFLRECLGFLTGKDSSPAVAALAVLLERKESRWPEAVRLYNELRALRTGSPSERPQASLGMLLDEIVTYRNRVLAHGAPMPGEHYRGFGELLASAFGEILRESPFLTVLRLVSFPAVTVEGGTRIECQVVEHMGLQPIRRETPYVVPLSGTQSAPTKGVLYLLGEDGDLTLLDPLLIAHREDVYFLNEADGSPEYLSYSTGERHRPADLPGAQGELFGRILGYDVDGAVLSRIGDDVAAPGEGGAAPVPGEGERRLGDYRIVREIGRGAMGVVFEAIQESLGRRVALKVLPGTFALDPRRLERFRREARATARIHHPSIVPVYEVGEAEGSHYYAMERIDGIPLDQVSAQRRDGATRKRDNRSSSTSDPAYIAGAVEQMATLAEGLDAAHRQGLIHRDVKPSNVLVDRGGRYVLVDFGLVHDVEAQSLTRSGELIGTLAYMSPEQVSRSEVDARTDVYSLGATLYEILTLRAPFECASDHETQRAILFEEPFRPRKLNPRLNRDLETIVLHALEKNPARRYASAGELAADLRRFLRYEPIQARPLSPWTRIARKALRQRWKVTAVAATAVLVLLLVSLTWIRWREARLRETAEYEPRVLRAVMRMQVGLRPGVVEGRNAVGVHVQGLLVGTVVGYFSENDYLPRGLLEGGGDVPGLLDPSGLHPIETALAELEAAAAAVPVRPDAHYHRARGLFLLGRLEEARQEVDHVLELDPDFSPALLLMASIESEEGGDETTPAAGPVPDLGEGGWSGEWLLAYRAVDALDWSAAAAAYGRLAELMESSGREPYVGASIEILLGRGLARLEAKDFLGALVDFAEARGRFPRSLEPALLVGKTYLLLRDQGRAEELLTGLHGRWPAQDAVALGAASLYASLGETEVALEWAGKLEQESLRERSRAFLLLKPGLWLEAIEAGERALALDPGDARTRLWTGLALLKMETREKAAAQFREAAKLDPRDPWPHHFLGEALFDRTVRGGRAHVPPEVVAEYREAIRLDPRSPLRHVALGDVLRRFKPAEAEDEYRKALGLDPRNWLARVQLAVVLKDQGRIDEALAECRRVGESDHRNPQVHSQIGWILEASGDQVAAIEKYREAIALDPKLIEFRACDFLLRLLRPRERPEFRGKLGPLIETLERALREGGEHPQVPAVLELLGLAHLRSGTHDGLATAVLHLRRAVEASAPGSFDEQCRIAALAEALFVSGSKTEAIRTLEDLLPDAGASHDLARPLRDRVDAFRRAVAPDLVSYASIDAALASSELVTLVPIGADWRYLKGKGEPSEGSAWTEIGFDDSSWQVGPSGFGYSDGDDATVLSDMVGTYTTLYVRHPFTVEDPGRLRRLLFLVRADDGFVAYLNGVEVHRANVDPVQERLPFDAVTTTNVTEPLELRTAAIEPALLRPGRNVLAIQGVNDGKESSDFSLIPELKAAVDPSPEADRKLLEAFEAAATGEDRAARIAYLQGRIAARAGEHRKAVERLTEAASLDPRSAEPMVALAESLLAVGDPRSAVAWLRRALKSVRVGRVDLLALWIMTSQRDLQRPAAEVLADFLRETDPGPSAGSAGGATASPGAWSREREALEELRRTGAIRIDCGGREHRSADGKRWLADRFYVGGVSSGDFYSGDVAGTEEDPLYLSERYFRGQGGYRIPLFSGSCRVTLHFAEIALTTPGVRRFDVVLEGRKVLADYEPLKAGFATADVKSFTVSVEDGVLDIDFVARSENPMITAIEVEKLP
ncbi:MAG: protein kinase [Planctomycetes bacterium]|nr:protein kinase [Planctomycetota bacterium]